MTEDQPEFCWHHSDLDRLCQCLDKGYCDLYASERGVRLYERHGLYVGMPVRFCVQGKVRAFGTIQSRPYDLFTEKGIEPIAPDWPAAVDIDSIRWEDGGDCDSPRRWGSHTL